MVFFRKIFLLSFIVWGLIFSPFSLMVKAQPIDISTSVMITICGNGAIEEPEVCDDGIDNGTPYAPSILSRYCNTSCSAWTAYCGDQILQQAYGEECDDGNNNSDDGCSATCQIEEGGGGAGGGAFIPGSETPPRTTGVVIKGKAYPGAEIHLLQDGEIIGLTKANSLADFTFIISDITSGVSTFGFWAEDKYGMRSIFLTVTFQVVPDAVTTISGIYLPPTIKTDQVSVSKGEVITIFGQTVPETDVYIHIASDNEIIKEIQSDRMGVWTLLLDTTPLEENDFHVAKAFFQTESFGASVKSGFGRFVSFYVGEQVPDGELCPGADLNKDGKVNLLDFSILLYHWGTGDLCADQNHDGAVGLADFSIMMYYWTG